MSVVYYVKAAKIIVTGIVQGVGFRPFIYRLAVKIGLRGYVKNIGGSSVEIHVEGVDEEIREFTRKIIEEKPDVAEIEDVTVMETEPVGYADFKILESDSHSYRSSIIPPDISICDDCLKEVLNPYSRFYLYPFHSCAYCGPRYSMIEEIPYDREKTSMKEFQLCDECKREYLDPENKKRFHAQGISCPLCGPVVKLYNKDFEYITEGYDAIVEVGKLINEGFIVAVKGVGGFHIALSATNDEPIMRLRKLKNRPTKPFAVMVLDTTTASRIVYIDEKAVSVLKSRERPILLLDKREDANVSSLVAPGLKQLGIFLPYTSLHYLLLMNTDDRFAIMTSGNPRGEPMCIDEECAKKKLSEFVDYFLIHNRRIVNRVDDSVVRFTRGRKMLLRRGRGYAPTWSRLPFKLMKPVVAFGAMLQNAGALAFDDKVILTQYIGDIDDYYCFRDLERYIMFLIRNYKIDLKSTVMAADMNPTYPSTMIAEEWSSTYNVELHKVQHHWAHVLSVATEYQIKEEFIGIAVDGAGYGLDKTVWGGEVLRASYEGFERVGHLKTQPMPSGDLAVKYPARMLAGILSTKLDTREIIEIFKKLDILPKSFRRGELEIEILLNSIEDAPKTSSTGRVLDAASVMLGVCYEMTYEGEPAIRLEAFSKPSKDKTIEIYPKIILHNDMYVVDTTQIILDALNLMINNNLEKPVIGYMVQKAIGYGLGLITLKTARRRHRYLILSGGAAVNEYIVEGVEEAVGNSDLKLLLPSIYPANDGGISLGQVAAVGWRYRIEE
ncbi:MAG: carbamoyltransferase HypF [Nitrososphaerota archaeon]